MSPVPVVALLGLGSLAALGAVWSWAGNREERLVARAYEAGRPSAVRLEGARFTEQRRMDRGGVSRNIPLLEAEAAVARRLASHSGHPRSLKLSARIQLLNGYHDAAIQTLLPLSESEEGFSDLGAAYLARAISKGQPADYESAIEYLSRALQRERDDLVALFNRGLALEGYFLLDRAEEDWTAYLGMDGTSGWAGEARQYLNRVRQRRESWNRKLKQFGSDPGAFTDAAGKPTLPSEPFLDPAFTQWLPAAGDTQSGGPARPALALLATRLIRDHEDYLLANIVAEARSPRFFEGAELLSKAITQNDGGERKRGLATARLAAQAFRAVGSEAAAMRADEVALYALSRDFKTVDCLKESETLLERLRTRRYPWMSIQTLLARAVCLGRFGDLGASYALKKQALQLATGHGYAILTQRAQGILATSSTNLKDPTTSRDADYQGLEEFWRSDYPPLRAYQFYSDLTSAAESGDHWHAGYAVAKEALGMIVRTRNRQTEAMARFRLAKFAELSGRRQEARDQLDLARQVSETLDGDKAFRAEQLIGMAAAYLQNGAVDRAREELNNVKPEDIQKSFLLRLDFSVMQGKVAIRERQITKAREHFQEAHAIAKAELATVSSGQEMAKWQRATGPIFRHLTDLLLDENKDPDSALALWEEHRSAAAWRTGARTVDAEFIRRFATGLHDASVLSFLQLENRLVGWFYDDRGITAFSSGLSWKQAEAACSQFRSLTSQPGSDMVKLRESAQRLYGALITPVAAQLDSRRVLVVEPDGPCAAIAFETLADSAGVYLADRFTLMTSPGGAGTGPNRLPPSFVGAGLHAVIVGDPRLEGEMASAYPALPEARTEAAMVTGHYPRHTLLTGPSATLEAVRRSLAQADVFHFAGHGLSTSENGSLLLAPAGNPIGAADLQPAKVEDVASRCRLVVLSACGTGAGERRGPFNPDSLVQAFWRAGMPTIIASRWAVDSRAALRLMTWFYRDLAAGAAPAVALRAAARELRKDPAFAHPSAWGAFQIFGNPTSTQQEQSHARR